MADNTQYYGARWVRSESGQNEQPTPQRFRIASGYQPTAGGTNVDLHVGDPVTLLSTGYVQLMVGSEGTQTANWGVIVGFSPEFDGTVMQPRNKHVGGSGVYGTNFERQNYCYVVPAVGQVFEMDCDDASTATTYAQYLALIGENVDMVLAADTTNANDPKATPRIDISTHNPATATLQARIIDISPTIANQDFSGNYVKLYVTFNKVQQAPYQTTGV